MRSLPPYFRRECDRDDRGHSAAGGHSRRHVLQLTAGAVALPALSRTANSQDYPSRPVRIVVAFGRGGGIDATARLIGQSLSDRLGQPFAIDNQPGAGGNASTNDATETVVRAPPDGHTLLLVTAVNAINVALYKDLNFDFTRDIAPIASISRSPNIMVVNPAVPARTVPEFIAYAKANAGKLKMASSGIGRPAHLTGELFKMMAEMDMITVHYRGAVPAVGAVVDGQAHVMVPLMAEAMKAIREGKLRPLAVTTAARAAAIPDVPPMGDFVPGYEASAFFGIGVPRRTPAEVVNMLNREINTALSDPKVKAELARLGGTALAGSPTDFDGFITNETAKWAKVIKSVGIKPE